MYKHTPEKSGAGKLAMAKVTLSIVIHSCREKCMEADGAL